MSEEDRGLSVMEEAKLAKMGVAAAVPGAASFNVAWRPVGERASVRARAFMHRSGEGGGDLIAAAGMHHQDPPQCRVPWCPGHKVGR